MSTHNLCFEQKFEKHQGFVSETFQFLEVKFSKYLNRRVFVMLWVFRWGPIVLPLLQIYFLFVMRETSCYLSLTKVRLIMAFPGYLHLHFLSNSTL